MIQSNKGICKIEGTGADLIIDLNHLFDALLDEQPELLIAVTTAWSGAMERKATKADEVLLNCLYKISSRFAKEFEND